MPIITKQCGSCKQNKEMNTWNFYKDKRTQDGFCPTCKECRRKIRKVSYKKHATTTNAKVIARKQELLIWTTQYKIERGCCKCGEKHPACLEFHHDKDNKDVNIAYARKCGWKKERLLAEMEKCVVICANCHRKEHYQEPQRVYNIGSSYNQA